jgi:flavin reductase (DIM6/NTAB) family NADH-FMN oxidoreductase RutF
MLRPSFQVARIRPTFQSSQAYNTDSQGSVRSQLRTLLRQTAQPVAVITSLMPPVHDQLASQVDASTPIFHGATLSSFTSIALHPYPLVAFSLRVPSRMSSSLRTSASTSHAHMIINILSSRQKDVAVEFSRPHMDSDPFARCRYWLSQEGLPIFHDSLGALSCHLMAVHDLSKLRPWDNSPIMEKEDGPASELFIARVLRIEDMKSEDTLVPLLYHQQSYTTVQ